MFHDFNQRFGYHFHGGIAIVTGKVVPIEYGQQGGEHHAFGYLVPEVIYEFTSTTHSRPDDQIEEAAIP